MNTNVRKKTVKNAIIQFHISNKENVKVAIAFLQEKKYLVRRRNEKDKS